MLPKPYYDEDGIVIYNCDCRDILEHLPKVDLVLTDPPYGIDGTWRGGSAWEKFRTNGIPDSEAWDIRDTKLVKLSITKGTNAIVWGGNYFELPPTNAWLIWDKIVRNFTSGHAELAWTTGDFPIRAFNCSHGELASEGKEHPTQKPLKVMSWCLSFFPDAQTILDPFMGSGTTLVAAKNLGKKAIGIEISEEYCRIAVERLAQKNLFGQTGDSQ